MPFRLGNRVVSGDPAWVAKEIDGKLSAKYEEVPMPDEYLGGWFVRMAKKIQVYDETSEKENNYALMTAVNRRLTYEKRHGIYEFRRHDITFGPLQYDDYDRDEDKRCFWHMDTLVMLRSMYPVIALFPFMTMRRQTELTLTILQTDPLYDRLKCEIPFPRDNYIRYCPDCMREAPYFRTWQNLPGVSVCPIHGKYLKLAEFSASTLRNILPERLHAVDTDETPSEQETRISGIYRALYYAGLFIDFDDIKKVIGSKMKGININTEAELNDMLAEQGYSWYLEKGKIENFFEDEYVSPMDTAVVLACLYNDPDDFIKDVEQYNNKIEAEFNVAIEGKFTILSDFGALVELKCNKCGKRFIAHAYDVILGGGCPQCDDKLSHEELMKRRVTVMLGDEYDYVFTRDEKGEIKKGSGKLLHKGCGRKSGDPLKKIVWTDGYSCPICKREEYLDERFRRAYHEEPPVRKRRKKIDDQSSWV